MDSIWLGLTPACCRLAARPTLDLASSGWSAGNGGEDRHRKDAGHSDSQLLLHGQRGNGTAEQVSLHAIAPERRQRRRRRVVLNSFADHVEPEVSGERDGGPHDRVRSLVGEISDEGTVNLHRRHRKVAEPHE